MELGAVFLGRQLWLELKAERSDDKQQRAVFQRESAELFLIELQGLKQFFVTDGLLIMLERNAPPSVHIFLQRKLDLRP